MTKAATSTTLATKTAHSRRVRVHPLVVEVPSVVTVRVGETRAVEEARSASSRLFSVLIGAASLAIVLQGLWAGLFIHEGKDFDDSWVGVHARGAELAVVLAFAATMVAVIRLRERRDLWIGSSVLTVLLIAEAYLGGLIGDKSRWTAVHLPLAMALMGLAVWLPLRSRARVAER